MDYLWYSFKSLFSGVLPWAENSKDFFFNNVLQITKSIENTGNISMPVLI
jgi:hypothetical protein